MKAGFFFGAGLVFAIVALSILGAHQGWALGAPDGSGIAVRSVLSQENVRHLLADAPSIATSFPPFGTILLVSLGASLALTSGLMQDVGEAIARVTPKALLSPVVFAMGLISHQLSDALLIIYLPVAGMIFASQGRSPVVGVILGFAAFSGALYASFGPGLQELILMTLTSAATGANGAVIPFNPLAHWWFSATTAVIFLLAAWAITDLVIEKRWADTVQSRGTTALEPTSSRRGLIAAGSAGLIVIGAFAALVAFPGYAPLRDGAIDGLTGFQPALKAGAALLTIFLAATGSAYAVGSGRWLTVQDVASAAKEGMSQVLPLLLFAIAIGFLSTLMNISGLGDFTVVLTASFLEQLDLPRPWLLTALAALTAVLDFVVFSASAKWAIMAPTLVPVFDGLGLNPYFTMAAFRLGDSVVNIVNPLQPAALVTFLTIRASAGHLDLKRVFASLAFYAATFAVVGMTLLLLWFESGWPLGPFA